MLVVVYLRFDVLKDDVWLIHDCQLQEVLVLLILHQLDEGLANLPVLSRDPLILIQGLYLAPLLLELHVHLPDPIDTVCLLPD